MAKKKKVNEVDSKDLKVGDRVVGEDEVVRQIVQLEQVLDPRGNVFGDSLVHEWYVRFEDGHRTLLSGTVSVAA